MAANLSPIFVLTPNCTLSQLTAAQTARDASDGNITLAFTAGTNGSRVDRITFTTGGSGQTTANTAMVCRIYVSGTAGTGYRLYKETALAAVTPSAAAIGAQATINIVGGLILKSGQLVGCTQSANSAANAADNVSVVAEGGDF